MGASRGESLDSDSEGDNEGGIRVSTYVRDWLVRKSRSSMEHASRINSTADSTTSGASASVHSGSNSSSSAGGRSTPSSPVGGAGIPVVSPLAAALERAKADRVGGGGSSKAASGTSSPKTTRSKTVLGAIKEEHVEV
jgi:hypothetical protein